MIKKLGLGYTASRSRLPLPAPLLWTSAALHKPNILAHIACRAVVQRQPLEELLLPSIFVMDVHKNCGFCDP